jgi:hypothetical protein
MCNSIRIPTLIAACLAATACEKEFSAAKLDAQAEQNAWMVWTYQDDVSRAGVVAQATIYPHHFDTDGAALNELGKRDIATLAAHYAANPGRLNVRRGGADDALYTARVKAVTDALTAAGVLAARVSIADGQPGGAGALAERAVLVMGRDVKPLDSVVSTRGSSANTTAR